MARTEQPYWEWFSCTFRNKNEFHLRNNAFVKRYLKSALLKKNLQFSLLKGTFFLRNKTVKNKLNKINIPHVKLPCTENGIELVILFNAFFSNPKHSTLN